MNDPDRHWQKLVEAARRSSPESEAPEESAPPGFASRIISLRDTIISIARTLLWRRWSVAVALLCFAALLILFTATRCSDEPRPLIEAPESILPNP